MYRAFRKCSDQGGGQASWAGPYQLCQDLIRRRQQAGPQKLQRLEQAVLVEPDPAVVLTVAAPVDAGVTTGTMEVTVALFARTGGLPWWAEASRPRLVESGAARTAGPAVADRPAAPTRPRPPIAPRGCRISAPPAARVARPCLPPELAVAVPGRRSSDSGGPVLRVLGRCGTLAACRPAPGVRPGPEGDGK